MAKKKMLERELFDPTELVSNFAKFTGRVERTEEQIENMVQSLLAHGQLYPFTYRKADNKNIPVTGHTRIIAADRITKRCETDAAGNKYNPDNPFMLEGVCKPCKTDLDAIVQTFVENDNDTRTPLNNMDIALFIGTLSDEYRLSDAAIADRLGKVVNWVVRHKKALKLDPDSQKSLAKKEISLDTAINKLANVEPEKRKAVIAEAKKEKAAKKGSGKSRKIPGSAIAEAIRKTGTASEPIPHTEKEFKDWAQAKITKTEFCPATSFLVAIFDFRAGRINTAALDAAFYELDGATGKPLTAKA